MSHLDAILFDADGVFQRPPPDLAAQLARGLALEPGRADELILELFRAEADALTGERDIFTCVAPVLDRWGVANGGETFADLWRQIEVDLSVLDLVKELRRAGFYCAVASNQQADRARTMSVNLGYAAVFDAEFYSCHLGLKKPDEAYFREVVRRSGFEAARTLFVDDRKANIAAAQRAGLQVVQFAPAELVNGGEALRGIISPLVGSGMGA